MKLSEKQAAVAAAELRCEGQRLVAQQSLDTLKSEFRRSATPARIVVSGLALGFASGIAAPRGAAAAVSGRFLSGPVFSMLFDSLLPGLMAGISAAATAEQVVEDTAAEALQDATETAVHETAEAAADEAAEAAPARPRPRRRRKRRPKADVDT
jgi:hypothetical protein